MENGNAGTSCPIPLSLPAEKSKHTKTSCKSFKALPEAVTGAPAFGFREVFCVSGNAMIHTIPYDIRLCMLQPSSDTGRKKSRRRRERYGIRGPSLSLCQKSLEPLHFPLLCVQ